MDHYADSSFLVSCYLVDFNTPQAQTHLASISVALPFTALHALEVRNALQLGVFRGLITATQAAKAWMDLETDLSKKRLVRTGVKWPVVFRVASLLSQRHAAVTGTRSLDILHIAVAKSLRSMQFISFDTRQNALAASAGLKIAPVVSP